MKNVLSDRSGGWRSRWAAVGAAVAVTLGAGGVVAVNAAPSEPSSFVSITPARILDTRSDVGLEGPFVSDAPQTLQVTGTVPTQPPGGADPVEAEVVPAGATSVVLNVTVVKPATNGFLSIRPGDATGTPATSNINWAAGGANIANAVTVQLPTSGEIDIFVNGTVGQVLIDVAGYNTQAAGGIAGPQGDQGIQGDKGIPGDPGSPGVVGPVTMFNGLGPTFADTFNPPAALNFYTDKTEVVLDSDPSALNIVQLDLLGPAVIGGKAYQLKSVEYCVTLNGAIIDSISINTGPLSGIGDPTDITASGCHVFTLGFDTPDAPVYGVAFSLGEVSGIFGGSVSFTSVQSTWEEEPAA